MSLAEIGKLSGRSASTVGYWVSKHGLVANGRERHAARGGIDRGRLEALVRDRRSSREIAAEFGVSQGTVRHWLRQFELTTARAAELAQTEHARRVGAPVVERWCHRHGRVEFPRRRDGAYRCPRCNAEAVARRRRRVKDILVDEAGGCCLLCGYDRYAGALQFHHLDPAEKGFPISRRGVTRSLDEARREAKKCVLLCANCHAEVEGGFVAPPAEFDARVSDGGPR